MSITADRKAELIRTHARGEANIVSSQKFATLLGCHSIYTAAAKRRLYRRGTK